METKNEVGGGSMETMGNEKGGVGMETIRDTLSRGFDESEKEGRGAKRGSGPRVGLRCILFGHFPDKEFDSRLPCSFTHDGKQRLGRDGEREIVNTTPIAPKLEWKMHRCSRCGTLYLDAPVNI